MKRISLLLIITMLLSVFSTGVFAEDNLPTILANASKTENNTIELVLSITENSNIAGCSFNVVYDSEKLTYLSHEVQEPIASMMNVVNPEYNPNAIRVLWASGESLTVGGDVVKIVFTINDEASGDTEIALDKLKMMDIDSNPVDCSCESVTVSLSDTTEDNTNEPTEDEPTSGNESDDNTSSGNSSTGNSSSGNSSSGNGSASSNKPSESETTKEPINNNETDEPVVEDENKPSDGTEETTEEDYEVFLLGFDDVKESDWFFESVRFAKFYNLMGGFSETEFAPMNNLTRGMLVTILYRLEGEPECSPSSFTDVEADMWYSKGISWAAENKVVNGMGDNKFAPNENITREQIAVIMYNYSTLHSFDTTEVKTLDSFTDSNEVSTWAKDAMEWAVGTGLLSGYGDGVLNPKGNATRAEIATILMRYVEKYDQNGA